MNKVLRWAFEAAAAAAAGVIADQVAKRGPQLIDGIIAELPGVAEKAKETVAKIKKKFGLG
jgi:hypothetical protein